MNDHRSEPRFSPGWISDWTGIVVAVLVMGLSTIDILKLYEVHWFKEMQPTITLFLVSALMLATILEKRYTSIQLQRELIAHIQTVGPDPLTHLIRSAGVRNFYTSRADYAKYRGAGELQEYLRTASKTIDIVAYWLAHGMELEGVAKDLAAMVIRNDDLCITIAMVNPESPSVPLLASYLDLGTEDVKNRVRASVQQLQKARDSLPELIKPRLKLKVYDTLPIASMIMLDAAEASGRIQLDVKLYHTARQYSLGLEIERRDSRFYERVRVACSNLIRDAKDVANGGE
jgi:hypothetical protein